jgi:hypothetical protein
MSAADLSRSFGRDPGADTYGRHALIEPGGDNWQVDVIKLTGSEGIALNAVSPSYVGRHRFIDREWYFYRNVLVGGRFYLVRDTTR